MIIINYYPKQKMRFTAAAAALCVASTQALTWDDLKQGLASTDFSGIAESISNVVDSYELKTIRDVNERVAQMPDRTLRLEKHHVHAARQAHHNIHSQRARLGLPKFGGPVVGQDFSVLNSWAGMTLSIAKGMAIDDYGSSRCYNALEDSIIAGDTLSDVVRKLYKPAMLPEFQILIQDMSALYASVYVECNVTAAFSTATKFVSAEGQSELIARAGAAIPFEIRQCQDAWAQRSTMSTQEQGYKYGKCISIIFDWRI